ncbi:MAG TPA: hypothetical protein VIY48_08775 [Candidatus Paceibacterota bacterium]
MPLPVKTWYNTPEFLVERKKWYDKLKADGYNDIEFIDWSDGSSGNLLNGFGLMDAYRQWSPDKQRYFELATHHARYVRRKHHASSFEYQAWKRHANGKSNRVIAEELNVPRRRVAMLVKAEKAAMLKAIPRRYGI